MRLITKQAAKLKEFEARRERPVNRVAKLDLKIEEKIFKDIIELDKQVVDRIVDKVHENDFEIEMEMGVVKDGMVKVLFLYKDPELLQSVINESVTEEYDLP